MALLKVFIAVINVIAMVLLTMFLMAVGSYSLTIGVIKSIKKDTFEEAFPPVAVGIVCWMVVICLFITSSL